MEEKDFTHSFSREDNDPRATRQLFLEMQKKREELDNLLDEKEKNLLGQYDIACEKFFWHMCNRAYSQGCSDAKK